MEEGMKEKLLMELLEMFTGMADKEQAPEMGMEESMGMPSEMKEELA